MLSYGLAFVALFLGDLIGNVLALPVHAIDKKLQWTGKSPEHWQSVGVESPAERLRAVSFVTGLVCTFITRLVGFWAAGRLFTWRGTEMPVAFIVVSGAILLLNDGARVARFLGSSGVWIELGYAVGGLTAVALLLLR
jgi:hypothetical protein